MKFKKFTGNPILSANEKNDWESLCVLNPAVIYDEEAKLFKMLYRAAGHDKTHYIHLGYAESADGFHFERKSDTPVLSPALDHEDGGCIEDPRLVKMGDWYYLTYAARPYAPGQYWSANWRPLNENPEAGPSFVQKNATLTHLAISRDLKSWKRLGRITDSRTDDRDVILFPKKIGGKYYRLSRPMTWCGEGYPCSVPSMWIASGDDLMEWEKPRLLMTGEEWWESEKVGGSCPPIETEYGWLHLYHGVAAKDKAYRVGAVVLDKNDPTKILARTKDFLMEPEADYETSGYYNGCVFPTGNVVVGDTLYVYYGAADRFVAAASCSLSELMKYLMTDCLKETK